MTDATEVIVCPVCKRSFRYYTGAWIIDTPNVTYCSLRCAQHNLPVTQFDGDAAS